MTCFDSLNNLVCTRDDVRWGDDDSEWRTTRERVTYEEGRRVLEAQKSDIDDMDDKALRTVRITALLLGVGATGVRVIGVSNVDSVLASLSLSSFFLSLFFGVAVYNESNEVIGPSADYLGTLRRDELNDWENDLLAQIDGYVRQNRSIVEFNSDLFLMHQSFFVGGVALGTASLLSLGVGDVFVYTALLLTAIAAVFVGIRVRRGS